MTTVTSGVNRNVIGSLPPKRSNAATTLTRYATTMTEIPKLRQTAKSSLQSMIDIQNKR